MKSLFVASAAAVTLAASLAVPSLAHADDDRRGWQGYRGGHGYGYGAPRYKHAYKHAPRPYYVPPARVYYPPPRIVYPAPVVVAPPPPVVVYPRPYPPVGHVSIGFGFHF